MALRLTIEGIVYGGSGMGRREDGKIVFVPYTAPGDVCTVEVVEEKRDFSRARVARMEEPSPVRIEPFCQLFGRCGGCQLQHLPYGEQLKWKTKTFQETIKRSARVELTPCVIPAESPQHYRAKATFHVDRGRMGFFEPSSHRVVEVEDCPLLEPAINTTLRAIKEDTPAGVHTIDVALDMNSGKTTAVFYTEKTWLGMDVPLSGALKGYEVRAKRRFQRGRGRRLLERGDTECSYTVEGVVVEYAATVFFQVNPEANRRLVRKVVESVGGRASVVDAFCGVGNFSLPLAKTCCRVDGFDMDGLAIGYAKKAARLNRVDRVRFHQMDVEGGKVLEKMIPSVIVLDPPRCGCRRLARELAEKGVERIIYVSCNPSTLGRDIKEFLEKGYRVVSSTLVDMFPQTYHVEGIVVLTL